MPGQSRKDIVREGEIGTYHTWSRCVRSAFLLGEDPVTGINYDHRRDCLKKLLEYQATVFAVDLGNYTILSNHFHVLPRIRPDLTKLWSDEEVAWRWKRAWPKWVDYEWIREPTDQEVEQLMAEPKKLAAARDNLGSLSWYMARIKEPVAKLFNQEDEVTGHFFEQRFGSREILDDAALIACSGYIDLNQIQAGMANSLEESNNSAIQDRIIAWQLRQAEESLQQFRDQNRKRKDLLLETGQLLELFADGFLSPISSDGPLLMVPEYTENSNLTALKGETADQSVQSSDNQLKANQAEDEPEPSNNSPSSSRGHRKKTSKPTKEKTREIHKRCWANAKTRVSDNLFLNMPFTQYWNMIQCLAQPLVADPTRPPNEIELPLSPTLSSMLEKMGLATDRLADTILNFHDLFGNKVGHESKVKEALEKTERQRIRGIANCRDAFT